MRALWVAVEPRASSTVLRAKAATVPLLGAYKLVYPNETHLTSRAEHPNGREMQIGLFVKNRQMSDHSRGMISLTDHMILGLANYTTLGMIHRLGLDMEFLRIDGQEVEFR